MAFQMFPMRSDPKKFKMLANGRMTEIEFRQKTESELYDTIAIPAATTLTNNRYEFFRDIQGKTDIDTNISSSRKLLSGTKMQIFFVGIYFPVSAGNILALSDDTKKIMDSGLLTVKVNDTEIAKGQLYRFPIGYGLQGCTTRNDTELYHLGVPSTAAIRPMIVDQWIESTNDISAWIEFPTRTWDAAYVAPLTTVHHHVRLVLKGLMWK